MSTYLYGAFDCMFLSCHVGISDESTLYSCMNVKVLLARNRCHIWSLSDSNWTRTHNHLVRKRTLNDLAKLTKWLSCAVSTYLYGVFDCTFLSCHVGVQGTSCSKQARNLNCKWMQLNANPKPLSSETNTHPFSQIGQMTELRWELLSTRCIWMYVLVMSRTRFIVNPQSIVAWMSRNFLLEMRKIFQV